MADHERVVLALDGCRLIEPRADRLLRKRHVGRAADVAFLELGHRAPQAFVRANIVAMHGRCR